MELWWNEFELRWMARHPMAKTSKELVRLVEAGIHYFNYYNRSNQINGFTPAEYWSETI